MERVQSERNKRLIQVAWGLIIMHAVLGVSLSSRSGLTLEGVQEGSMDSLHIFDLSPLCCTRSHTYNVKRRLLSTYRA